MCSSDEIKEQLVDWYGGNISDWKRKSKKKKGSFDVRTFENKKLGLTKTIVSNEDEDEIYKPEYFPNGDFWIYVNKENFNIPVHDIQELSITQLLGKYKKYKAILNYEVLHGVSKYKFNTDINTQ